MTKTFEFVSYETRDGGNWVVLTLDENSEDADQLTAGGYSYRYGKEDSHRPRPNILDTDGELEWMVGILRNSSE